MKNAKDRAEKITLLNN